ncbi:MAG TPA: hypothetical protein VJN64_16705 [Terriglobales bacterium]|nr:hypothetical protein [Terriglobales bacterium]
MAEKKPDRSQGLAESTPNPHSEQRAGDDVVETDHSRATGVRNVARTPSTTEGRMQPSVAEGVEGAAFDDDSMFNNADPQIRPGKRSPPESAAKKKADTPVPAKHRKIA